MYDVRVRLMPFPNVKISEWIIQHRHTCMATSSLQGCPVFTCPPQAHAHPCTPLGVRRIISILRRRRCEFRRGLLTPWVVGRGDEAPPRNLS
ncbi:hypothetical protein B0H11DRAFT_2288383 [Mycena galericulata]|nr:hypothetical protein B0H11DRAFT_2288383 [Mycena galericulata]